MKENANVCFFLNTVQLRGSVKGKHDEPYQFSKSSAASEFMILVKRLQQREQTRES